ncbi:MAG: glycerol-3-phosphate 1-O-acyltransferase PlsY [Gemmatimonadaceae bacterium]
MHPAIGLVISYLLGSIPAALIAGRVTKGIDLREHGSGNLGATNALRTLGAPVAVVVLAFDLLKGALPVHFLPLFLPTPQPTWWAIGYGIAAIVGHVRPIFLLGRGGGKGVATAAGVIAALAPVPFLAALVVFVVAVAASRYVSLGSILGAVVLPFVTLLRYPATSPLLVLATFTAVFVVWTHRSNIGRLRRGEESRLGRRQEAR